MENNDFEFKYTAPTNEERKEIESIRNSYLSPQKKGYSKLERLRKLDAKVKNLPTLCSLVVGIIGLLIFGLGMAMVLEWGLIAWGIVICVISIAPMSVAYPVYLTSSKKMRETYSEEILRLSDELLNDEE